MTTTEGGAARLEACPCCQLANSYESCKGWWRCDECGCSWMPSRRASPSGELVERARAYLALAEKAAPGPWHVDPGGKHFSDGVCDANGNAVVWISDLAEEGIARSEDAALIAASHEAAAIIRALLAERGK